MRSASQRQALEGIFEHAGKWLLGHDELSVPFHFLVLVAAWSIEDVVWSGPGRAGKYFPASAAVHPREKPPEVPPPPAAEAPSDAGKRHRERTGEAADHRQAQRRAAAPPPDPV